MTWDYGLNHALQPPLTGPDPQTDPEFTGCRTCGHEDCPGSHPAKACPSAEIELRRERNILERQQSVLLDERDQALGEVDNLRAVIVDLHERLQHERERADVAEARLREWEIEHATQARYGQEQTG